MGYNTRSRKGTVTTKSGSDEVKKKINKEGEVSQSSSNLSLTTKKRRGRPPKKKAVEEANNIQHEESMEFFSATEDFITPNVSYIDNNTNLLNETQTTGISNVQNKVNSVLESETIDLTEPNKETSEIILDEANVTETIVSSKTIEPDLNEVDDNLNETDNKIIVLEEIQTLENFNNNSTECSNDGGKMGKKACSSAETANTIEIEKNYSKKIHQIESKDEISLTPTQSISTSGFNDEDQSIEKYGEKVYPLDTSIEENNETISKYKEVILNKFKHKSQSTETEVQPLDIEGQRGSQVEQGSQDDASDIEADDILNSLLNKESKEAINEKESDITEEELEEEVEREKSDNSSTNYQSFSEEEEEEVSEEQLNSLLNLAKASVTQGTIKSISTKKKVFKGDGTFYNPFESKIKKLLYIKTDDHNFGSRGRLKSGPALIQNDLVRVEDNIPAISKKRKAASNKSKDELRINNEEKALSSELNNSLAIFERKGLEEMRINRQLSKYEHSYAELKKIKESTTGSKWFNMPAPEMSEELKKDIHILKMRHVLDRKRFYKKDNMRLQSKYFQVGTVIEDKSEFYSSRLAKKDRKQTILEEVLHDKETQEYFKDRYQKHQSHAMANSRRPTILKKFKKNH